MKSCKPKVTNWVRSRYFVVKAEIIKPQDMAWKAIRKIKRYMEDEENLSKASQKIVKTRHLIEEEENHD